MGTRYLRQACQMSYRLQRLICRVTWNSVRTSLSGVPQGSIQQQEGVSHHPVGKKDGFWGHGTAMAQPRHSHGTAWHPPLLQELLAELPAGEWLGHETWHLYKSGDPKSCKTVPQLLLPHLQLGKHSCNFPAHPNRGLIFGYQRVMFNSSQLAM